MGLLPESQTERVRTGQDANQLRLVFGNHRSGTQNLPADARWGFSRFLHDLGLIEGNVFLAVTVK